jgi:hypothetical protein
MASSSSSSSNPDSSGTRHLDENLLALTQTLERDRNTDHYDPTQDKEVRRKLRQEYRQLIQNTEGNE